MERLWRKHCETYDSSAQQKVKQLSKTEFKHRFSSKAPFVRSDWSDHTKNGLSRQFGDERTALFTDYSAPIWKNIPEIRQNDGHKSFRLPNFTYKSDVEKFHSHKLIKVEPNEQNQARKLEEQLQNIEDQSYRKTTETSKISDSKVTASDQEECEENEAETDDVLTSTKKNKQFSADHGPDEEWASTGATESPENLEESTVSETSDKATENTHPSSDSSTKTINENLESTTTLSSTSNSAQDSNVGDIEGASYVSIPTDNETTETSVTSTASSQVEEARTSKGTETIKTTSDDGIGKSNEQPEANQNRITDSDSENCFEISNGYLMTNGAAGLEHDVSLSECECFCATSRLSSRYAFQCISATYYHNERDCILNIDDKTTRPTYFSKDVQGDRNVSYIGIRCSVDKIALKFAGEKNNYHCNEASKKQSFQATTQKKDLTKKGMDGCFLEVPNYVLEGTALAIELNVTVEQCKCYCIESLTRYNILCQSLQYYYNTMTCLLNSENRITSPERFVMAQGGATMHSYFDNHCYADNELLNEYLEGSCQKTSTRLATKRKQDSNTISDDETSDEDTSEKEEVEQDHSSEPLLKRTELFTDSPSSSTIPILANGQRSTPTTESSTVDYRPVRTTYGKTETTIPYTLNEEGITTPSSPLSDLSDSTQISPHTSKHRRKQKTKDFTTATTPESTTATSPETTTTITHYEPDVHCKYSSLYQTSFRGTKMFKRLQVTSPSQCLAACYYEGCRSANVIHISSKKDYCELFRDSVIDYRRSDILEFDRNAAYLDGIRCEGPPTEEMSLDDLIDVHIINEM
ncbi:hypothetical protein AB6A40_009084 [Gnathostoma spinigerum]|uniref:Apple domain-containing protein n=1 Tax=Gnathostoma spinigerum TaxID=75299 RepID=A0ABD6ES52_9BILA